MFIIFLSHSQPSSWVNLEVWVETIHLVEVLQSDAILLRDAIHAFTCLYDVRALLVLLWCLLAFLLQLDDVTLVQDVILVSLVVLRQLLPTDAHFFSDALEGISLASVEVVVVVEEVDRVEQALGVDRLVGTTVLSHKLVVSLRLVVLMQLVKFDDLDELVGVLWVGGIAALFQTSRPTLVVAGAEVEETGIARLASQELAVVLVALLGIAIYTEAFSTSVVIVILLRTHP